MEYTPNRREFLQGATLASLAFWSGAARAAHGPGDKLNMACIGVGGRGGDDMGAVADENIIALCDINRTRLAAAAKKFPNAVCYTDYRKLFDEQKTLEAVTVGVPDHHHAPASVLALLHGVNVYCEKPLTHTVYEARLMARLGAKYKLATQMGNQGHANGGMRTAVEVVRSGVLGNVSEVHVWTDRPIGWWPQGCNRPTDTPPVPADTDWDCFLGPAPLRPYHPCYQPFVWRGWWDYGTGALGDIACHMADMAVWALGLNHPVSVEAETDGTGTVESPPNKSTITYNYGAGERHGPLKLVWHDGKQKPPKELFQGEGIPDNGSIIVGDKATMYFPGTDFWKLLPAKAFEDYKPPTPYLPRVKGHHAEWLAACKGGPPTLDGFEYAGRLTEVMMLGNIALRVGTPIEWDGPNLRVTNNPAAQQLVSKVYRQGWDLLKWVGPIDLLDHSGQSEPTPAIPRHRDG